MVRYCLLRIDVHNMAEVGFFNSWQCHSAEGQNGIRIRLPTSMMAAIREARRLDVIDLVDHIFNALCGEQSFSPDEQHIGTGVCESTMNILGQWTESALQLPCDHR